MTYSEGWNFYRSALRTYDIPGGASVIAATISQTTTLWSNPKDYKPAPTNFKQAHWHRIEYTTVFPPATMTKTLESKLLEALFHVTSAHDATIAFVYKATQQNIKSRLTPGTASPTKIEVANFEASQGRAKTKNTQRKLVENSQQLPAASEEKICDRIYGQKFVRRNEGYDCGGLYQQSVRRPLQNGEQRRLHEIGIIVVQR